MTSAEFLAILPASEARVYLLCGVAGSGKTTLAKQMVAYGYHRLSIDEYIWAHFGKYGIDYLPADYSNLKQLAEEALVLELQTLLHQKAPVVIDFSFWQRATREKYKALIKSYGMYHQVVYLQTSKALLTERLAKRNLLFEANASFPITTDILDTFLNGFEEPVNEGQMVLLPG